MGYASLDQIVRAANSLTFQHNGEIRHTRGLWHVLFFLRATALHGASTLKLRGFDLAEPCFDVNGIHLPIEKASRNVYYEPAASGADMFRHRDGPRQTFLNRIQTRSLSGGLNKPNLFIVVGQQLPITVSLS